MKKLVFYCTLLFILFLSSCATSLKTNPFPDPIPLSNKLIKDHDLSLEFLESRQYQIGDDTLFLLRKINKETVERKSYYETVFINGELYTKLIFKPKLFCITRRDKIYFEEVDEIIKIDSIEMICDLDPRLTLMYKPDNGKQGNLFLDYEKFGEKNLVDYGGKKYNAINPRNQLYFIPTNKVYKKQKKYEERIVRGRTIRH